MFLKRYTGSLSCCSKDLLNHSDSSKEIYGPTNVPSKIHWITIMFLLRFIGSQSCSSKNSLDLNHVLSEIHWTPVMFLQSFIGSQSCSSTDPLDLSCSLKVTGSPSCFSKDSFDLSHVSPKILWTPVILLQKFYGSQRVLFSVGVVMKQGHHMVVYEETLETE